MEYWVVVISEELNSLIIEIQENLSSVISKADEISQEFRRTIHLDMTTSNTSSRIKLIRELLETDNMIRNVLAKLRQANAKIRVEADRETLLRDEEFLFDLYVNLSTMFKGFDRIYEVMEFDEREIDLLVMNTIDSLDELSHITR